MKCDNHVAMQAAINGAAKSVHLPFAKLGARLHSTLPTSRKRIPMQTGVSPAANAANEAMRLAVSISSVRRIGIIAMKKATVAIAAK
jgi:hypothetical protein